MNISLFAAVDKPTVLKSKKCGLNSKIFDVQTANVKEAVKLFSPATFTIPHRANENVEAVTAIGFDFDNGVTPEDLTPAWEEFEYRIYSTFNHTAEHPRWRAIFPLSRDCTADEWRGIWRKLAANIAMGEQNIDKGCKDPSRCYYLPSCPPERASIAFSIYHAGELLNPDDYDDVPEDEERIAAAKQSDQTAKGGRPGDIFEARMTWENLIIPDGYVFVYQRGDRIMVRKPGSSKKRGHQGEIGGNGYNGLWLFSPNCNVPQGYYSKFKYYAWTRHGGDYKAAARQLAKDGYTADEPTTIPTVRQVTTESGLALEVHEHAFQILSASDVIDIPRPPMMVEGLLRRGDLAMMLGQPKAGKSFILLDMATALASGHMFAERFAVEEPLRVLYATNEGRSALGARLGAIRAHRLKEGYADDTLSKRFFLSLTMPQLVTANRPDYFRNLIASVENPPDVFILDPWINATLGADENDAGEQTEAIMALREVMDAWNCAAVFAHHSGWEKGRTRGSSALDGHCDIQIVVERGVMRFGYAKDADDFGSLRFALAEAEIDDFTRSAYVEWHGGTRQAAANVLEEIIAAMENGALERQWWTAAQLSAELPERTGNTIRSAIKRAEENQSLAVIRPGNRQSNLYGLLGTQMPEET